MSKYLKILLDETPDLAEYLVACLPSAEDLLPPELLAKIPDDDKPASAIQTDDRCQSVTTSESMKRLADVTDQECTPPVKVQRPSRPQAPPPPPDLSRMPPLSGAVAGIQFELEGDSLSIEGSPHSNKFSLPLLRPPKLIPRPHVTEDTVAVPQVVFLEESPSKTQVDASDAVSKPSETPEFYKHPSKAGHTGRKSPAKASLPIRKSPRGRKRSPKKIDLVVLEDDCQGEMMSASDINDQLGSVWEIKQQTSQDSTAQPLASQLIKEGIQSTDVQNKQCIPSTDSESKQCFPSADIHLLRVMEPVTTADLALPKALMR